MTTLPRLLLVGTMLIAGASAQALPRQKPPVAPKRRTEATQAAPRRSFLQRLRPFKSTTIILAVGVSAGPFVVGASSHLGLVLRGRDSPEPQGFFWQNGADAALAGIRNVTSPVPELRGWEWNVGPRGRRHPVYGDRVGVSLIPDILAIAAARTGGLGLGVSLPIPGVPFMLARLPVSLYIADPSLCRAACAVNDGIDQMTAAAGKLVAPIGRGARKLGRTLSKPVTLLKRIGRAPR